MHPVPAMFQIYEPVHLQALFSKTAPFAVHLQALFSKTAPFAVHLQALFSKTAPVGHSQAVPALFNEDPVIVVGHSQFPS